jgi:uncharacterized protein (DUF2126 family)
MWDSRGVSKPNPYMSTSKLVTQMDLQVQNNENYVMLISLFDLKASESRQNWNLRKHDHSLINTTPVHVNGNMT